MSVIRSTLAVGNLATPFVSRRTFLASAAALAALPLLPRPARAVGRITVGDTEVVTVSDGTLTLPLSFIFPDAPQEELKALLAANGMPTDAATPDCNVTIARMGDKVIAFDCGSGPNFMPTAGKLMENLAEAGVDPAEVTDVVFTHGHPDHLWGVIDDFDEPVFPEAAYHFPRTEWDIWRADDTLAKIDEARQTFVIGARNRMDAIEDKVTLFDAGAEVLPGVEAMATVGHTPGHTSFVLHSGSEALMVVGDAISNHVVSFAQPGWPSGSDHDPATGAETRKALLDRLANDKMRMIGYHMPHPGAGIVERDGAAYRYAPVS